MKKIKILFLVANPENRESLNWNAELRAVENKLLVAEIHNLIDIKFLSSTRKDDLITQLKEYEPDIIHFSGHGNRKGELVFVDESNFAQPMPIQNFIEIINASKQKIKLLFLNACHSYQLAQIISQNIDCTIGFEKEIDDHAAIKFAEAFYRNLARRDPVQESFNNASRVISSTNEDSDNSPMIFFNRKIKQPAKYIILPEPGDRREIGIIVEISMGIMLLLFPCNSTFAFFIVRYFLEGRLFSHVSEVITISAVLSVIFLAGWTLIIDGSSRGGGKVLRAFLQASWEKYLFAVLTFIKKVIGSTKSNKTIHDIPKTIGTVEWTKLRKRIFAAFLSLVMPGLGLFVRGFRWLGIIFLIFTTIGYLMAIIPGIILHLLVIFLSLTLVKPNDQVKTETTIASTSTMEDTHEI